MSVKEPTEYEEAVAAAAEIAAQRVAAIHRKRLVIQCFLASLVVSAVVGLLMNIYFKHQNAERSKEFASFNCQLFSEIANTNKEFIRTDAVDRRGQLNSTQKKQLISQFSKLIAGLDIKKINEDQEALDKRTVDYWQYTLEPQLEEAAKVNCEAKFT